MLRCKRAARFCTWSFPAASISYPRCFSATTSRTADDDQDGPLLREPGRPDRELKGETVLRLEGELPSSNHAHEAARQALPQVFSTATKVNKVSTGSKTTSIQSRKRPTRKDKRIGSLRRRMAQKATSNIPFEQLPYQCFQEARKILMADRADKISHIKTELAKIRRLEAQDPSVFRAGEYHKKKRLKSLRQQVEKLKVLADINDPIVKRRFEDGLGDMTKPIYRYLAKRKWESMDYKIIQQRVDQFHIVPDVLPKFRPVADVAMWYRGYKQPPGQILDSAMTEVPPVLHMKMFDAGQRLLSVVVMDSDVPDAKKDAFGRRLHFLAVNIPWDPTQRTLPLIQIPGALEAGAPEPLVPGLIPKKPSPAAAAAEVAVPWLPPFSQKGAPYHRLSIFVLQQDQRLDARKLAELYGGGGLKTADEDGSTTENREDGLIDKEPVAKPPRRTSRFGRRNGFKLPLVMDRHGLTPVGYNILRTKWDDHTADVMARHDIPGADVEFRPEHVRSLKPPRAPRGWEAKRQKPKYKHLWKYSKRIARTGGG